MNDREALERTLDSLIYCPTCHHPISSGEHDGTCWLGKHLHPETVEGSAAWADAQGRAGKWVRRRSWGSTDRVCFYAGKWLNEWGVPCPDLNVFGSDDWELYVEPKPTEGTAEWAEEVGKTEWVEGLVEYGQPYPPRKFYDGRWRCRNGTPALLSPTECSCAVGWRIWTPPEPEPRPEEVRWNLRWHTSDRLWKRELCVYEEIRPCVPAAQLPGAEVDGYRLDHFEGTTKDGRTVDMGSLTRVWVDPISGDVRFRQTNTDGRANEEPVWASVAVMEKISPNEGGAV